MKTIIKGYALIGFGAAILKVLIIGKGAIVVVNSVVTKDAHDWTLIFCNLVKYIKI